MPSPDGIEYLDRAKYIRRGGFASWINFRLIHSRLGSCPQSLNNIYNIMASKSSLLDGLDFEFLWVALTAHNWVGSRGFCGTEDRTGDLSFFPDKKRATLASRPYSTLP